MPATPSCLTCLQLEARDCPTVLQPGPPLSTPPPIRVTGVSDSLLLEQDLIVINQINPFQFEVLHHRGWFHLDNGIVAPDINTTPTQVSANRYLTRLGLRVVVDAGEGDDFVVNNTSIPCSISGGSGHDYLVGGSESDTIAGGSGNDTIAGMGGNDDLDGGEDSDTILGGAGDDYLNGGAGGDYVNGDTGADHVNGGNGLNHIYAGMDHDVDHLSGGVSTDYFYRDWEHVIGNIYTSNDVIDNFTVGQDYDERL